VPSATRTPTRPGTLAGITEIGAMLGGDPKSGRQRANKLAQRPGFPRPIDRIAAGPVWRRIDVERYLKGREASRRERESVAARQARGLEPIRPARRSRA
jgi:hypothetical protein